LVALGKKGNTLTLSAAKVTRQGGWLIRKINGKRFYALDAICDEKGRQKSREKGRSVRQDF